MRQAKDTPAIPCGNTQPSCACIAAPVSAIVPSLKTAAQALKVEPITKPVRSDVEIEAAIIALGGEPGGGLVVMPDVFTFAHRVPIILAAARNNVPVVYSQLTLLETADCSTKASKADSCLRAGGRHCRAVARAGWAPRLYREGHPHNRSAVVWEGRPGFFIDTKNSRVSR